MNSGKLFEEDFKNSLKGKVAITRLYDTMGGQVGVANICDFIVSFMGYTFYLELKSTKTGTLPIKNISKNQFSGLLEVDKFYLNYGAILVKFAKFNEHYYIPIDEIERIKNLGKKSISRKDIKKGKIKHVVFPATIKRTRFTYDFDEFLRRFKEFEQNDNQ